jgi:hypothetical protein
MKIYKSRLFKITCSIFFIFSSALVYTLPSGLIACPLSVDGNYCYGDDLHFFALPIYPFNILLIMALSPVLSIFQWVGNTFNLWYEIPFTPQPINERNAVLPLFGWVFILASIFIYSTVLAGILVGLVKLVLLPVKRLRKH